MAKKKTIIKGDVHSCSTCIKMRSKKKQGTTTNYYLCQLYQRQIKDSIYETNNCTGFKQIN